MNRRTKRPLPDEDLRVVIRQRLFAYGTEKFLTVLKEILLEKAAQAGARPKENPAVAKAYSEVAGYVRCAQVIADLNKLG